MTAEAARWIVRLTAAAEADYLQILRWTSLRFGRAQARSYAGTLSAAVKALASGPTGAGIRRREDVGKGIFSLHVSREGRKGRHVVIFRIGRVAGIDAIDVLRLLHDAMDLPQHLPHDDEPE